MCEKCEKAAKEIKATMLKLKSLPEIDPLDLDEVTEQIIARDQAIKMMSAERDKLLEAHLAGRAIRATGASGVDEILGAVRSHVAEDPDSVPDSVKEALDRLATPGGLDGDLADLLRRANGGS